MGGRRITAVEADERHRAVGLEPIDPYVDRNTDRRARCQRCGTTRWIKLGSLGKAIACRWCLGWENWLPWAARARALTGSWREINTNPADSLAALERVDVIPVTAPGDEFHPVGFLCPRCGETGVTVPERIGTAVGTVAAARPATTVVRSVLAERSACGAVTVGAVVVVTDMAFSLGSAAPDAPLITSTNAAAPIDPARRNFFDLSCRNRRGRS